MPRQSPLTPQFTFDDAAGQYRGSGGRFVPRAEVRRAIDGYIESKAGEVKGLAEQLRNREISIPTWQRAMESSIAKIHLANAAAAKGGWHNMTPADFGRVGQLVKAELGGLKGVHGGLRGLAKQIENGLPLDGRFDRRAQSYAQAGRHTFHVVDRLEMQARGLNEVRSVRNARDSCDGCLEQEAKGWQPADEVVLPGERDCLRSCRCDLEYRAQREVDQLERERGDASSDTPLSHSEGQARHEEIQEGIDAVASVVDMSEVPKTTVLTARIGSDNGRYNHETDTMEISVDTERPLLSVAHESGHAAEWKIFGDGSERPSMSADYVAENELHEWALAVRETRAFKEWEQLANDTQWSKDAEYWMSPNEMFARSFAQYVARNAPDDAVRAKMLSELDLARAIKHRSGYWEDDDFAEIEKAMRSLFQKRGILVK